MNVDIYIFWQPKKKKKRKKSQNFNFKLLFLISIEPNTTLNSSSPWFHWKLIINLLLPSSSLPFPNLTHSTLSLSNHTFSLFHNLHHSNFLSNSNPYRSLLHSLFKGFQKLNFQFAAMMKNFRICHQKGKFIRRHCSWLSVPCLLHSLVWSISWATLLPLRFVFYNQSFGLFF